MQYTNKKVVSGSSLLRRSMCDYVATLVRIAMKDIENNIKIKNDGILKINLIYDDRVDTFSYSDNDENWMIR